jgi:hypothetical protein
VRQRAVPLLVRRPVDAAAVGGPHAQAGHVGDVRGVDLDDVGAGPAADGQPGYLGDDCLAVAAGRKDGQRPVHLESELRHRPGRVVPLHFGDGDPRGGALGRIIQHGRSVPGALFGVPDDLLVHRGQGAQLAVHGLGFPGGEPLHPGRFDRAGLPGDGAACLGLGAPGVLPGLLVQQPQRAPARRPTMFVLVFLREPFQLSGDSDGPGAEQVHDILADSADLGAVTVGPGHHGVPERRQLGLQDPVGDRGDGEPLVVQGAGVQGPPLIVGPVGALNAVPDRDVDVELRVAVPGQVVQEQAGDQAPAVAPLPGPGGMVTGPGVGGMPLEPADGFSR